MEITGENPSIKVDVCINGVNDRKKQETSSKEASHEVFHEDKVVLSSKIKELQEAKKRLHTIPDIREETIEKISMLVADCNPAVRDALIDIFTSEGYDVHGAEGGLEALERLEHSDYQVVIVETKMPDMDGFKLVEQIAQKYPNTVVIVTTAYGGVEGAVEAMKVGAYDFIEKPLTIERLLNTVRRAIERRSAQKGQKSCPKCHEKMQSDWQYCPYDGTKVG